jgi:hypothetical protein
MSRVNRWGKAKIIEIIGNVFIPFFYWEATTNSSFGFKEYLSDIYQNLPQLNRYAKLRNLEKELNKDNRMGNKFYKDQGLLFLKEEFCEKRNCDHCPILVQHKEIDKNFENN